MFNFLRLSSALAALLWLALGSPSFAQSSPPFNEYDPANTGSLFAAANEGRSTTITVSAPYQLTSISMHTETTDPGQSVFFVYDRTSSALVYATPPKAFAAGNLVRDSDRFPPVTLQPGRIYAIGSVSDVPAGYATTDTGPYTSGLVTNQNPARRAGGFPTPTDTGFAFGFRLEIRLNAVPEAAAVPTMSEWAMIVLALGLAGAAVLIVQRRRMTV